VAGIALVDWRNTSDHRGLIAGLLVSMITLGVYATLKGHVRIRPLEFEALRNLRGDAIRNHALNLALALPDWSMPILVGLSAADSGAFFIAWMMAGVAMFIPASLAQSLNAVCARNPELLPTNMRLTLRMSFVAGVVVWLATALVGPFVLGLLGNRYFEAAPALVILALDLPGHDQGPLHDDGATRIARRDDSDDSRRCGRRTCPGSRRRDAGRPRVSPWVSLSA
jgi:O-antigen/teichoic acid export membrane protein